MDIVDPKTRSKMMSAIKSKNTTPELKLRKALFARGLRYSLHNKKLQGSPDMVFTKYKSIVFIHGCFWHMHNCYLANMPKTNASFWKEKLLSNVKRDKRNIEILEKMGWRVMVVWQCVLGGKSQFVSDTVLASIIEQIKT
jgi:DNA mismatch endonuclease (patch repair protein)